MKGYECSLPLQDYYREIPFWTNVNAFSFDPLGGSTQGAAVFISGLTLTQLVNISGSGWDMFLNSFGDIPGMFVHYFQIITNMLYVCQSVSWPTSFLKLYKYRDISISWWNLFQIFFVCLSVCYLAHFLTEIRQIWGYILFLMRYLSEIFWRHSWDVCTLFKNNYKFLVFLSVC